MCDPLRIVIRGSGASVPEQVLDNDYFISYLDTSDEWIVARTGIRERRKVAEGQSTGDLALEASQRALEDAGMSAGEVEADIHARWDEKKRHHAIHTISNAEIVAMGLLWGELDFGRSICLAVQACFDTDCNGATAGSILGMMLGAKKLPARWTRRAS